MHHSFVYTGLFELERKRELDLQLVWLPPAESSVVTLEVVHPLTGAVRRVCFDIHDRSYVFNDAALRECDTYYKRSYHQPDVDAVGDGLRDRIAPFGPVYVSACRHYRFRLVAGWLNRALKSGRGALSSCNHLLDYLMLPDPRCFERPAAVAAPGKVLLQTRLWTDREVTGAPLASEINAERVELVRVLKAGLGDAFIGGLVPTPLSRQQHPDLVCAWKTKRRAYLATMQACLIGVYSRGLHDSTAWKLGEYLASSLCIVASGLRNALPVPLDAGRQFLPFTSPEECLEQCRHLLSHPQLVEEMRSANFDYYQKWANPAASIRACLDKAFAEQPCVPV